MTGHAAYQNLLAHSQEIALIDGAGHLLSWDQETYMPRQALAFRAEQLAYFSSCTHRLFTAPEVGDWIKACEDFGFPAGSAEAGNVREWRRVYDRKTKIPQQLVEEFQRAQSFAREAWLEARRKAEFAIFRPHLEKLLALNLQMANHWGYEESPYDAVIESYEPGARAAELKELFAELRPQLVALAGIAAERFASIADDLLAGDYPVAAQQAFNREVAEAIGFDFASGRIDATAHPFCSGIGPGDCRLTTRYNERDFTESLYSILHETGHGLYEQGLRKQAHGTPAGTAASLGLHESQSRLWENHVGRNVGFWEHWLPRARHHFPTLKRFSPEQVAAAVNRVAPSFIRVEADEVTYDLHIILRFEIELKLLEGEMAVADVPQAWNEQFEKLLRLKVPNDALGCLQDIHWSFGSFGYFPTYTLGNLNASQLFRRAKHDLSTLEGDLTRGEYRHLLQWLREKVHQQGQRLPPQDLMRFATGEPTQSRYYLENLRRKFG